jgi:alanine racemase
MPPMDMPSERPLVEARSPSLRAGSPSDAGAPSSADGELSVDLAALRANYASIAKRVAPARSGAVIKADAYGLGVGPVARALGAAGCRDFFVVQLGEAALARPHLPDGARLFVLNGVPKGSEAACLALSVLPVLSTTEQITHWARAGEMQGRPLDAALQFDSGMSRLGLSSAEAVAVAHDQYLGRWLRPVLILSHLACADAHEHPANEAQRSAFGAIAALFPGVDRSLANSGGAFLPGRFHGTLVRPGIALFGGRASDAPEAALRPVVALRARVLQVRDVMPGAAVGYGHTHVATSPARWATIGVGYADGWPRNLGNRGAAWHAGIRLPIIGRVSMDSMTVDLADLPADALREGDWVDLIGRDQTVDAVAAQAGTIAYEILTGLGRRLRRSYISAEGDFDA